MNRLGLWTFALAVGWLVTPVLVEAKSRPSKPPIVVSVVSPQGDEAAVPLTLVKGGNGWKGNGWKGGWGGYGNYGPYGGYYGYGPNYGGYYSPYSNPYSSFYSPYSYGYNYRPYGWW